MVRPNDCTAVGVTTKAYILVDTSKRSGALGLFRRPATGLSIAHLIKGLNSALPATYRRVVMRGITCSCDWDIAHWVSPIISSLVSTSGLLLRRRVRPANCTMLANWQKKLFTSYCWPRRFSGPLTLFQVNFGYHTDECIREVRFRRIFGVELIKYAQLTGPMFKTGSGRLCN